MNNGKINFWLKKNNYLVLSIPVKLNYLDPIKSMNAHSKFILPLIFESLITLNAKQELQPVLAKSWQITEDKKSIIITLQSNHHFSDGSELTAKDIVNSIYRLCSPGSRQFGELRSLIGCVDHVKGQHKLPQVYKLDKYHVQFNINDSPTTFLNELSSPSTVITKIGKAGLMGSAPYLIKQQDADYLELEKNPFYAGEIKVNNQGITLFYASGADLIKIMKRNSADGSLMYKMNELSNFKDTHYKIIKSNPNITEILVLNNQRFPFNNTMVRKALATEIYNNFNYECIPGSHKPFGIIPYGIGGSINNMQPRHLTEISPDTLFSVVPSLQNQGTTATLHQLYDTKNACESTQLIQAGKKYNIDIKFKYHKDYSDLLPLYLNHHLDGFIDLYVFRNREAYRIFELFTKNGENNANIDQDKIDKMLKEATNMPSSHGRFQAYRKLAQYIQDNSIVIPIFYMDHGNLMKTCLTGISDDFFFNPFLYLPQISKAKYCLNNNEDFHVN